MALLHRSALILPLLLALTACGDDSDTSLSPEQNEQEGDEESMEVTWTTLEERPCPEDSYLTYENFGEPFMLNWCTGCHSEELPDGQRAAAPLSVNLNTSEDMTLHLERIWARSADLNVTMPPAGGPSDLERWMLGEWLACGAP